MAAKSLRTRTSLWGGASTACGWCHPRVTPDREGRTLGRRPVSVPCQDWVPMCPPHEWAQGFPEYPCLPGSSCLCSDLLLTCREEWHGHPHPALSHAPKPHYCLLCPSNPPADSDPRAFVLTAQSSCLLALSLEFPCPKQSTPTVSILKPTCFLYSPYPIWSCLADDSSLTLLLPASYGRHTGSVQA